MNWGSVFFFHTELCHIDHWFNTEQELWYLFGSWCFGSAQNLAVLSGKFLIHPVVVHHFENLKTYAINHNKFYYSLQHILHVSVITDHPRALNAWYLKLKIKCIYTEFVQILFICICVCVCPCMHPFVHPWSVCTENVKLINAKMQKCLDITLGVMCQWKWQR